MARNSHRIPGSWITPESTLPDLERAGHDANSQKDISVVITFEPRKGSDRAMERSLVCRYYPGAGMLISLCARQSKNRDLSLSSISAVVLSGYDHPKSCGAGQKLLLSTAIVCLVVPGLGTVIFLDRFKEQAGLDDDNDLSFDVP